MFGSLGGPEVILLFILALLLFGPRRLPDIGKTIGKAVGEFRKATHDFRSSLEREVEIEKLKDVTQSLPRGSILSEAAPPTPPPPSDDDRSRAGA